jgi:hypothetical protein
MWKNGTLCTLTNQHVQRVQACEGCKRRREAMKAAFKNANLSAPPPPQQAVSQPQHPQPQH